MEKRIKERYNETILQEAMRCYRIAPDQIRLLDGFESFMYEFERGSETYILRIGHSFRRTVPLIQGEVDWINHLAAGGAGVAKAIASDHGNLVELIDDGLGETFLATAFVKARGRTPTTAEWNPDLFEPYGQLLGRMHALSKAYEPPEPSWRRLHWNDAIMLEVEQVLPASDGCVLERFQALMEHLRTLPRDGEGYGLIHQDAHAGNFFVDEVGQITLFDFDDCTYGWYAYDIAVALFYAVLWDVEMPEFTRQFMIPFLRGYRRENRLDAAWLREIPHFLKLREIDLYAVIHRSFGLDYVNDPWCARYMHNRKQRIEDDVPFIDFDFESLAEYL